MKSITIATVCFLLVFPLASSASADIPSSSMPEAFSIGKSRPQVRAELVQAEREGWISDLRQRAYPPSETEMRRNRELYQARATGTAYLDASAQRLR